MRPTKKPRRWFRRILVFLIVGGPLGFGAWLLWEYHGPAPEREIFQGISYGCERLPDTDQSGGLFHWVRADLNVPGVSLYVTPKDRDAMAQGYEYKLKYTSTAVTDNHLAAAVNGTLFNSKSWLVRLPGDLANATETVVADHQVNHLDPNSYLMWWDDDRRGSFERWKPPPLESLRAAKWGIGTQEGVIRGADRAGSQKVDERTVIAEDTQKKLVWICCFDRASYHFIADFLSARGVTDAICVDGGTSMAMSIGSDARDVRPGTVTGNWRPVATCFGFRALPLDHK